MRIGYGFDSHEFRPGIPLKIGGVTGIRSCRAVQAEVVQARGSHHGRQSLGGAAERCLDLAQAGRPVPVVFRCHPASVPW